MTAKDTNGCSALGLASRVFLHFSITTSCRRFKFFSFQKGSIACVELLYGISGHVDKSCFGSGFALMKPKRIECLVFLLNCVIRNGVAPKRLEKILADILYTAGDVPELVDLLLKHGAAPTQSALTAATTYGHAKV